MIGKVLKELLDQPNPLDKILRDKSSKNNSQIRGHTEPWVSGQLNYIPPKKKGDRNGR